MHRVGFGWLWRFFSADRPARRCLRRRVLAIVVRRWKLFLAYVYVGAFSFVAVRPAHHLLSRSDALHFSRRAWRSHWLGAWFRGFYAWRAQSLCPCVVYRRKIGRASCRVRVWI